MGCSVVVFLVRAAAAARLESILELTESDEMCKSFHPLETTKTGFRIDGLDRPCNQDLTFVTGGRLHGPKRVLIANISACGRSRCEDLRDLDWVAAELPVQIQESVVTAALDSDRIGIHLVPPRPSAPSWGLRSRPSVYFLVFDSLSRITAQRLLPLTLQVRTSGSQHLHISHHVFRSLSQNENTGTKVTKTYDMLRYKVWARS